MSTPPHIYRSGNRTGKTVQSFREMMVMAVERGWCSREHAEAVLYDFDVALGITREQETSDDPT